MGHNCYITNSNISLLHQKHFNYFATKLNSNSITNEILHNVHILISYVTFQVFFPLFAVKTYTWHIIYIIYIVSQIFSWSLYIRIVSPCIWLLHRGPVNPTGFSPGVSLDVLVNYYHLVSQYIVCQ